MLSTISTFLLSYIWWITFASIPLFYLYATRNHDSWRKRGINGPPTIPIIGNFFSLTTPVSLLYGQYMRRYGKIYGIFQGQMPVLVVTEPAVIKRILVKDFHLFRNRTPFCQEPRTSESSNLVDARDERWKRVLSIVTPMFTTSKLRKMEPQMNQCTDAMIDTLDRFAKNGKPILAHSAMGNFTMDVIGKCAFATDTNASEDNVFLRNAREILKFKMITFLVSQVIPFQLYKLLAKVPPFKTGGAQFFGYLAHHLIEKRKVEKESGIKAPEDLFQLMINAQHKNNQTEMEQDDLLEAHHVNTTNEELEQEKNYFKEIIGAKYLVEQEIIEQSIVFFIAGYETTASALSYCLFELASNLNIQRKLYEEIQEAKSKDPKLTHQALQGLPYLDAVISETLRKYPPGVTVINRECTATDSYSIPEVNLTLKKGDIVLFPVYAIHHCEEFHPEPERFNPDRFLPEYRDQIIPYSYLPFGGGPRNCVGMRFALKEAKLGLANIVDRYKILPTSKTPKQLKQELCTTLLKTEPIYLKISKRS